MDRTFSILTIGCKLNQYESECIRSALIGRGWKCLPLNSESSVYILNTCTVTAKSDSRCRNAARRIKRNFPGSLLIATGCYAEVNPEGMEKMEEVDLVVANRNKGSIPELLEAIAAGKDARGAYNSPGTPRSHVNELGAIESFGCRSRAFVKIQDGCDSSCSYCIVPQARGHGRSVPSDHVIRQVEVLLQAGYSEIVLVGIHIGRYGADLEKPISLSDLVELLLEKTAVPRIRLSSIEPTEVTENLISITSSTERVAHHFHIPLQSGDDQILRKMNRPYSASLFRNVIERIHSRMPEAAIGTDVIVGFPGEEQYQFENTKSLIESLPISYLHVFSFSPRPRTPAARIPNPVGACAKKDRSRVMIEIGKEKRRKFGVSQIGTEHLAVVIGGKEANSRFARTLTGNYCEVLLPVSLTERSLVRIGITHERQGFLYGDLLAASSANTRGAVT